MVTDSIVKQPGRKRIWIVITGLDPVIHPLRKILDEDRWMPGSSPGMTNSFPRRDAPEFFLNVLPSENQRAQGKPGARCTRSRACRIVSTRVSHHRFTGITRPSLRDGFTGLFRALPGDRACLPPSSPRSLLLENLTPASGRQDHTTSPSARNVIRPRATARLTSPRPSHPEPNVRDDRETPLMWAGMTKTSGDLAPVGIEMFLQTGLDRQIA
jgi:hypothetical protein